MLQATRSAEVAVNSVVHSTSRTLGADRTSRQVQDMSYQRLEDEEVHSSEDDELEGLQREMSAPAYVPSLFLVSNRTFTALLASLVAHRGHLLHNGYMLA